MCVAKFGCVGGCRPHCVCVYVCVCVSACFFPFHTRKGALMLYILYLEPTMGHLEAPTKRCCPLEPLAVINRLQHLQKIMC